MEGLATSLIHRPYVFIFLAAYLFLSWLRLGPLRLILWLILGYTIALLSEVSSINNGFPYGEYHYFYENLKGELLIAGVPFFDSLSYVFLTFAGFSMAEFILESKGGELWTVFLGAILTTALDVIIDPIATLGDKWFLGQIHWYAHPGEYFGVPLTNFGGWFLVSLTIIGSNVILWKVFLSPLPIRNNASSSLKWLYPAFYIAIALFSITVSYWVGEWKLGFTSTMILAVILLSKKFISFAVKTPLS